MPTQTEIDDVLAKVTTYQTAKTAFDTAQVSASLASNAAVAARSRWDAAVANGETNTTKLTALLNDLATAETESIAKQATAQTAGDTAGTANNAINNTLYEILHPAP